MIGAIAWRYDGATAWWLPPPSANDLRFGAFVFEARIGDEWLASDESWTGRLLDGWAATRELKADARTSAIPVLALTAHAMDGARKTALEAGCDDYDSKPVELERLLSKIERLLRTA